MTLKSRLIFFAALIFASVQTQAQNLPVLVDLAKEQKWQVCKTAPIEKVMYRHLLIVQCVKFRFSKNATKIKFYLSHEFDVSYNINFEHLVSMR